MDAPPRPRSPCVGRCGLLPDRPVCAGCGRTLDEIARWSQLDAAGREPIWLRLETAGLWPLPPAATASKPASGVA